MHEAFKEYLFTKHILVNDKSGETLNAEECFSSIVALAKMLSIRIKDGFRLASQNVIKDAARYLGEDVPEPFYRGFPQSVKQLSNEEKLFDQLLHYTQTYGMGWFDEVGHSEIEEVYKRLAFDEETAPKDFRIVDEYEATDIVKGAIHQILHDNTRPLNIEQQLLVWEGWQTWHTDILPESIPCKSTVVLFLYKTKDVPAFAKYLKLSDVIKLLEYIQYNQYGSEKLNKLNLKNQDRKLLTRTLDWLFDRNGLSQDNIVDIEECFEKRRIWCGLLHHIHYKPKYDCGELFCHFIREAGNMSHMSVFETLMAQGRVVMAARYLKGAKGPGALQRNLDYILSRCENEDEILEVLENV